MVAVERPRRAHGGCWGSCGDGDRSRTDPAGPGALSPLPRGLLPVRSVGSGSALTQKVVGAEGNLEARQPPPSPPPPPGPGVCCAPGVALPVLGTAPSPGRAALRVPSASPSGAARGAMCGGVELRHALLAVAALAGGVAQLCPCAGTDPGCVTRPSFPQGTAVPLGCLHLEFASSVCPGGFAARTAASRSPLRCVIRKEGPWGGLRAGLCGGSPRCCLGAVHGARTAASLKPEQKKQAMPKHVMFLPAGAAAPAPSTLLFFIISYFSPKFYRSPVDQQSQLQPASRAVIAGRCHPAGRAFSISAQGMRDCAASPCGWHCWVCVPLWAVGSPLLWGFPQSCDVGQCVDVRRWQRVWD